jgi:DNA helicase HerA-like ATPase
MISGNGPFNLDGDIVVHERTKSGGTVTLRSVPGWAAEVRDRGHRKGFTIRVCEAGSLLVARAERTSSGVKWAQARDAAALLILAVARGIPFAEHMLSTPREETGSRREDRSVSSPLPSARAKGAAARMIILHDSPSGDLSHIQAIADIEEGFALYDYVRIGEDKGASWIGQIIQPNQNISTVGGRLDPTILHGLKLMQAHRGVQSVDSVQIFDIQLLGAYDGQRMTTLRVRPLPGAKVIKLDSPTTCKVIEIPAKEDRDGLPSNVIGELLNADGVPLAVNQRLFNYHFMISGGTGSGKSNAAANLVEQALRYGKCVIIHDAKPDYRLVSKANTDPNVKNMWERFKDHNLGPHGAHDIVRVNFFDGGPQPDDGRVVIGFRACDFDPDTLASLFFPVSTEVLQYENFAAAANVLWQRRKDAARERQTEYAYTLKDILDVVESRVRPRDQRAGGIWNVPPTEEIHEETGKSILRKVNTRKRGMPWIDAVGKTIGVVKVGTSGSFGTSSRLDGAKPRQVELFQFGNWARPGRLIIVDYSNMDEQSYALILSYFLRFGQLFRKRRGETSLVQLVDEAHRIFDNESRHSGALARHFERVMREGRTFDHGIILSLQNASQIPPRVMNNLNSKIVMRQNSKQEADAACQTMGKEFAEQAMRLGTGHALVSLFEARATVLAQMAPSPYELERTDNTTKAAAVEHKQITDGNGKTPGDWWVDDDDL